VPDAARAAIDAFSRLLVEARRDMDAGASLSGLARRIFDGIGLRAELSAAADGGPQGALRYGNVEHLVRWLERYESQPGREKRSLQTFLERVTLRGDPEEDAASPGVVLSTLHAAKGLEFGVVFLIGCVEGQLPHSRTTDPKVTEATPSDVDEERRLFYVGVTRARDRLYLTRPERKQFRGETLQLAPSRFLEGLPDDQLESYSRKDSEPLDFDEIAELGRAFLEKARAS
jgi:superfamily I DNA/RNA helicase